MWRQFRRCTFGQSARKSRDIESIDFITVFGDGVPDSFHAVAEPQALAEAIKGTWNSSNY